MKFIISFVIGILFIFSCKTNNKDHNPQDYLAIQGFAEGTYYRIIYHDKERKNIQHDIDSLLRDFEHSLSVYDSTSIISRVNANDDVELDDYFIKLFERAQEISSQTNGAFDISGEALFAAWGFSYKNKIKMDEYKIDSLMQYVGMDKIRIEERRIIKTNPNVALNCNAIAKGFSTDIVAAFLDDKACNNYLVDIGGEMRMKGKNQNGQEWRIGIDSPIDGNNVPGNELQVILGITDKSLATSGNYRRFYIDNGKKIAHTINPRTGYPTNHTLLSCTVIADDCTTADAFATAFMVVGLDSAKHLIEKFPELDAYFIYDDNGTYQSYYTKGIEGRILKLEK